jgi:hypothetical protein
VGSAVHKANGGSSDRRGADPDVWLHERTNRNGSKYYEYLCVYVAEIINIHAQIFIIFGTIAIGAFMKPHIRISPCVLSELPPLALWAEGYCTVRKKVLNP